MQVKETVLVLESWMLFDFKQLKVRHHLPGAKLSLSSAVSSLLTTKYSKNGHKHLDRKLLTYLKTKARAKSLYQRLSNSS